MYLAAGAFHLGLARKQFLEAVAQHLHIDRAFQQQRTHGPAFLGNEANPLLPALLREMAQAIQLDLAVAFVTEAGLDKIERNLIDLVDPAGRNGRLRFLTGDYLGVTEPRALRRLLDLSEEYGERAAVRVFETDAQLGFHEIGRAHV